MALSFQFTQVPLTSDMAVFNYSAVDIAANLAVSVDTVNVLGGTVAAGPLAGASVQGVAIVPVAASGNPVLGVTQEIIKAGSYGRLRPAGIAFVTASGAVTAGTFVDAEVATGFAKAHVAAKAQLGLALSTAANGDPLLVLVAPALNA